MIRNPIPLLAICILALLSCSPSKRETTLRASLVSVNATRDAFVAYDAKKQQQITDVEATSYADGLQRLAAYKAKRSLLLTRIEAAYRVIAAAAVLDSGLSLVTIAGAAALVEQAWRDLQADATPASEKP